MDRGDQGRAGGLIREYRQIAGLTQRQLADAAGVSVGTVRDLEQGRTTHLHAESIRRLTRALRLDRREATELARTAARRLRDANGDARRATAPHLGQSDSPHLSVLGRLGVWRGGVPLDLGTGRQPAVLGLLALHPNAGLHRETIIDALWGDSPPASAVNQVQAYVSRLRRVLDPGRPPRDSGSLLVCLGTSYALQVTSRQLDLLAFRDSADRARAARRRDDLPAACGLYENAVGLWRGRPLADVDLLRGLPAVTLLAGQYAALVTEYAEVAFMVSQHERVLPCLRALASWEPLNERVHAHLMIALAASGQQAAALQVFESLRLRLDEQLGVYPGTELAEAHARILRQDLLRPTACPAAKPAISEPPAAESETAARHSPVAQRLADQPAGTVVPQQLPVVAPHFAGRGAELEALSRLLDEADGHAGTVVISAIGGTAGIGKTALALRWAHQVADRFPDGQLYVNLRGFGPSGQPLAPAEAVRGFLAALGIPAERIPVGLEARVGLYRSLLADRRMLILLDNAVDTAQVRPLLPGGPGCMVVVTSRRQLTALAAAVGAYPMSLDVLTDAEAHEFLARRLGADRLAAEPGAVNELIVLCARLPLALGIAAAQAAVTRGLPLAARAAELHDAHGRLDALDGGEATVNARVVFSWSFEQLSPAAARMFRLLGLHPGPDITVSAAASLAGTPCDQARRAIAELTSAFLLAEHCPGRYKFHDLLRAYAAEQAEAIDGEDDRQAAIHRVADHYLHTANAAHRLLYPARPPIRPASPHPGTRPEDLAGDAQALAWFDTEHQVLLGVVNLAFSHGLDGCAWQLPAAMETFLYRRGHWHDWDATQRTALTAAKRLGDLGSQAHAHRGIASARIELACYDDARRHLAEALCLREQVGDLAGRARIHLDMARACSGQGYDAEALRHDQIALQLYRAAGHTTGELNAERGRFTAGPRAGKSADH
jgi:DNA-binding SARP family transcriptional activator/transcriptional regulator with XRE-family HTH domain